MSIEKKHKERERGNDELDRKRLTVFGYTPCNVPC